MDQFDKEKRRKRIEEEKAMDTILDFKRTHKNYFSRVANHESKYYNRKETKK